MFDNKNANNPNAWTYDPDLNAPASLQNTWSDAQLRLTWQAAAKHKIGMTYTQQDFCACHNGINATTAPEAANDRRFPAQRVVLTDWTSPLTSRILIEASAIHRIERWGNMHLQTRDLTVDPRMIGVVDQGAVVPGLGTIVNFNYRSRATGNNNSWNNNTHWRFNESYITGSHAFKFGVNDAYGYHENTSYVLNPLSYRFLNGVPNQLTIRALPHTLRNHVDTDLGIFAQDKWTAGRMTLSVGIRYDHHANSFPEQTLGPTVYTPNRSLTFAEQKNVSYHDITPKSQFAYDLFGNGKTALKVSLNKYLGGLGTTNGATPVTLGPNPINVLNTQASRAWTDGNRNYVPDCDLLNTSLQDNRASGGDLCGAFVDTTFGRPTPNTRFDPDLLTGWNKRFYNWEFSTGIQQEILPRVSLDVSYFRRWYGNFTVQDNLAVGASEYDAFSVTAPADTRLPDGGGYTVSGFKNLNPSAVGRAANNFTTLASTYGKQIEHWNGVDVNVSARLAGGLLLQGGTGTGRTSTDNCDIVDDVPESVLSVAANAPNLPYCHVDTNPQTQVKGAASYTIPRIDVSVAGTYQYLPGVQIAANWAAPNSAISPSLGRVLSANAVNQTVNLVTPGAEYYEGLSQLDVRFAKIVRIGATRTTINFDLYNALNANTVTTLNNGFVPVTGGLASWQVPNSILQARFFKIGAQFDF
jgi:hypothetical protein